MRSARERLAIHQSPGLPAQRGPTDFNDAPSEWASCFINVRLRSYQGAACEYQRLALTLIGDAPLPPVAPSLSRPLVMAAVGVARHAGGDAHQLHSMCS